MKACAYEQRDPARDANIFKPLSTPADAVYSLSMLVLAVCLAIFLVVAGVLTYTVVRFRRRPFDADREPLQVYGSNQIEIAWTVIPILIVIVLAMATARVITEVQNRQPPADALHVTIVGHQTFAPRVLYPHYTQVPRLTGLSPLDDQALAGMIMWVPGSLAFLLPAVVLTFPLFEPQPRRRASRVAAAARAR